MTIAITPSDFVARLAQVEQKLGQQLPSSAGEIRYSGIVVDYRYDGVGSLQVDIRQKPFFMPESTIESRILAWFAGS